MDVQSPEHLEKLRDYPEIKAALVCFRFEQPEEVARFERSPKNALYWGPIEEVVERFRRVGAIAEVRETISVYGRPCTLIATAIAVSPHSPYAIAVVAAVDAPVDDLVSALHTATHDYWYGSTFFK